MAFHVPPLDCSHVSASYCDFWKSTYTQLYNKIKIFSTNTNYSESAYQISKGYESILVHYIPWCSCSVTLPLNVWYRSWSQTYGEKKTLFFKEIKWEKDQKKKKKNCGSQNTQDVSLHNLDGYSFIWAKHTEGFSMFVLQLIHTYDIISKKQPAIPTFKAANHEKLLSTTMILLNHKWRYLRPNFLDRLG